MHNRCGRGIRSASSGSLGRVPRAEFPAWRSGDRLFSGRESVTMIAPLTVVDDASSVARQSVGWLVLAVLIAYGCAAVAPLLRHRVRGRVGALVGWCFVPIILACPLLIPSANVGLRAASAFASGEIAFKMVESFRHWAHGERS